MRTVTKVIPSIVLTLFVSILPVQGYAGKSEQPAPNFSIKHLLDGNQVTLNQYQGKVVYLDFWASWCPPCLKSFPFMEDLQTQYGKQGLVVLAVNLDENTEDAKEFLKEISARNTSNLYQIVITSGRFFIMVNNFSGQERVQSLMINLSNTLVEQIDKKNSIELFSYLPSENIVEGSQVLFCGPFSLQSIFTFGKGDVLLLNGKIFGISANYRSESSKNIAMLIIPYSDSAMALKAYNNLVLNLDPYLEIVGKAEDHFVFLDYNDEYGLVRLEKKLLKIKIHLPSKP